jgi:Concanavalin A-like lectin/glucanases superfamily/HYR domain/SprB repeat
MKRFLLFMICIIHLFSVNANKDFLPPNANIHLSSEFVVPNSAVKGTDNILLYKLKIDNVGELDATATQINFRTTGNYLGTDLKGQIPFKVYHNKSGLFSLTDMSTIPVISTGNGEFITIPFITPINLQVGVSEYFYITADINENAQIGNTIKINGLVNPVSLDINPPQPEASGYINYYNSQIDIAGLQTIINNETNPLTTITNATQIYCPKSNLELRVSVTGGQEPYTYAWSGGQNGFTSTEQNPIIVYADGNPNPAGLYNVVVTDVSGSTSSSEISVSTSLNSELNLSAIHIPDCNKFTGEYSQLITVGGTGNYTYSTSLGIIEGSKIFLERNISNSAIITVTDSEGCKAFVNHKATYQIYVFPYINNFEYSATKCIGEEVNLKGVIRYGYGNTYNLTWTGPNGFISHDKDITVPNEYISQTGNYTFNLKAIDTFGCIEERPVFVNVVSTNFNIIGPSYLNQNAPNQTYSTDIPAGSILIFSINPTEAGTITNSGVVDWAENFYGTATIKAESTNPCGSGTIQVTITPSNTPTESQTPIAQYPLNGDANDISSNHFDGVVNGGASFTQGLQGQALHTVPQQGHYVTIPNNSQLENITKVSLAAWVKPQTFDLNCWAEREMIIGKGQDEVPIGYAISIQRNTNSANCGEAASFDQYKFNFEYGGETISTPFYNVDNKWRYVSGTYDNDIMKLYVDGQLVVESVKGLLNAKNTYPMYFNKATWQGGNRTNGRFGGDLDNIRVYNRAISATEVLDIYNAEKALSALVSPALLSTNSPICANQNLVFTVSNPDNVTYTITGPLGPVTGLNIPNATSAHNGTYIIESFDANNISFGTNSLQVYVVGFNPITFTGGARTLNQNAPNETYTPSIQSILSISPTEAGTISNTGEVDWNPSFYGVATISGLIVPCISGSIQVTVNQVTQPVDLNTDMVAYYKFDGGSAADQSGKNNNPSQNSTTPTTDRHGIANNAANFGDGKYVVVPNSSTLQFTNQMSTTVWIKLHTSAGCDGYYQPNANGYHPIFTKNCDRGDLNTGFSFNTSTNKFSYNFGASGGYNSNEFDYSLNTWVQLASVYNGTSIKQYLNGVLLDEKPGVIDFSIANTKEFLIGKMACWCYYFNGDLDDMRIYNRVLSTTDIDQIYQLEKPVGSTLTAITTPNQIYCPKSNLNLSVTASGGTGTLHYAWTGPNGYTTAIQNPVIVYNANNASPVGTYNVVVTDNNGGSTSASVAVTASNLSGISFVAGPHGGPGPSAIICEGATGSFQGNGLGGSGEYSYMWLGPNGFSSTSNSFTLSNMTNVQAGSYSFKVTDTAGCFFDLSSVYVSINTPTLITISGTNTISQNAPNETYITNTPSNTVLNYSLTPVEAGTITNSGVVDWSETFFGPATIKVQSATECSKGEIQITVNQEITPLVLQKATISSNANGSCQGGTLIFTVNNPDPTHVSYVIKNPVGNIITELTIPNAFSTMSGTYTIESFNISTHESIGTNTTSVNIFPQMPLSFTSGATTINQNAPNETYISNMGAYLTLAPANAGTIDHFTGVVDWNANFYGLATITAQLPPCAIGTRQVTVNQVILPIDLNTDMVAHYKFEGNANDLSGNGNHGTVQGTSATFASGISGNGLRTLGVNSTGGSQNPDRVFIPNSSTLQITNAATFSYWVKVLGNQVQTSANCSGSPESGVGGTVIGKDGDRNGMYFQSFENSSSFGFIPWNGGVGLNPTGLPSLLSDFRHEVYVIENNVVKFYLNGVLKETVTQSSNYDFTYPNTRDIYIGTSYNGAPYTLGGACLNFWGQINGIIDEVRIYTRALSASEVSQINQLDKPLLVDTTPPTITCTANQTVPTDANSQTANVSYNLPIATDNIGTPTIEQIAGLASGANFPIGVTINTYKATDSAGNITNCSFNVTVYEREVPLVDDTTVPTILPTGISDYTLPPTAYDVTIPEGGNVANLLITEFPEGAASITIDGITYGPPTAIQSFTKSVRTNLIPFPLGGVLVPTNAQGVPRVVIIVTPLEKNESSTVIIPYVAVNEQHKQSPFVANITINFEQPLVANIISTTNVTCKNAQNGAVIFDIKGGNSPYSINPMPSGLAPNTYNFVITDKNGNTTSTTVTITEPEALVSTFSENINACNGQLGKAKLNISGGTIPYNVTISNGGLYVNGYVTGNAGTYNITITDAHACQSSATIIITECPVVNNVICTTTQTLFGNINHNACTEDSTMQSVSQLMTKALAAQNHVFGLVANNRTFTLTPADISVGGNNAPIFKMLASISNASSKFALGGASFSNLASWSKVPLTNTGKIANSLFANTMALYFNLENSANLEQVPLSNIIYSQSLTACVGGTLSGFISNYQLPTGVVSFLTNASNGYSANVTGLYNLANDALGGKVGIPNLSTISSAVDKINKTFNGCKVLSSPPTAPIVFGTNLRLTESNQAFNAPAKGGAYITLIEGDPATGNIMAVTEIGSNGLSGFEPVITNTYHVVLGTDPEGSRTPQAPNGYKIAGQIVTYSNSNAPVSENNFNEIKSSTGLVEIGSLNPLSGARMAAGNKIEIEFLLEPTAPLPVRLISLVGKPTEIGNELTWKTSSEIDFSHYELEKSNDAKSFSFVAKIAGTKSSKENLSYHYLDLNTGAGMVPGAQAQIKGNGQYYRLKMVDLDGHFEYSKIVFIDKMSSQSVIGNFYPNPVTGNEATVEINSSENTNWTITSFDVTGRMLHTESYQLNQGDNKVKVLLPYIPANTLLIKLENAEGAVYRKVNIK